MPLKNDESPAAWDGDEALGDGTHAWQLSASSNNEVPSKRQPREAITAILTATLVVKRTPPAPGRRHCYLYSVEFDGELVVENSTDAECDLARVLLARGIGGLVTLIDGATGKPRTRVNIAKAALLTLREDRRKGPLLVKWKPLSGSSVRRLRAKRSPQVGGSPEPDEGLAA
jgi:hypothetical protein